MPEDFPPILIVKKDGTVTILSNTEETGTFLWGRNGKEYAVYLFVPNLSNDINTLRKQLDEYIAHLNRKN